MLKKRELDLFLIKVPPHHLADVVKVRTVFDEMNTEPRPVSYLAEKTGWNLSNTTRFLTGSKHAEFFEDIGSVPPKLWRLREDAIRLELAGFDAEVSAVALANARDANSPGHSFDPVPSRWFKTGTTLYPHFPTYREPKWDEDSKVRTMLDRKQYWSCRNEVKCESTRWPVLNGVIYLDPFTTVCYIMTNTRGGNKNRLRQALEDCEAIHGGTGFLGNTYKANLIDHMLWFWTWQNLMMKNYTFFERDFKYLPSLWTGHVQTEYGLKQSVEFITDWMKSGPVDEIAYNLTEPVEDLWDEDA